MTPSASCCQGLPCLPLPLEQRKFINTEEAWAKWIQSQAIGCLSLLLSVLPPPYKKIPSSAMHKGAGGRTVQMGLLTCTLGRARTMCWELLHAPILSSLSGLLCKNNFPGACLELIYLLYTLKQKATFIILFYTVVAPKAPNPLLTHNVGRHQYLRWRAYDWG